MSSSDQIDAALKRISPLRESRFVFHRNFFIGGRRGSCVHTVAGIIKNTLKSEKIRRMYGFSCGILIPRTLH